MTMPETLIDRFHHHRPSLRAAGYRFATHMVRSGDRTAIRWWLVMAYLAVSLAGCKEQTNSSLPAVSVPIGKRTFILEVATGGAARQRGLMMRDSMPADHGMVFCFAQEQELQFWMRNTRIPLDILYVNGSGRIVSIRQLKPYDETSVPSDGLARFAIELNQGAAAEVGIKAGDLLILPTAITTATADP